MMVRPLLLAALVLPTILAAQSRIGLDASIDVSTTTLIRQVSTERTFTGPVIGGAALIGLGRFELDGRYQQGSLTPEAGLTTDPEDLVDLSVHLNYRIRPWVRVGAGPRLRAFIAPAGTVRWTRVEVRTRMEGSVIPGMIAAHAELWFAPMVETNVQGGGSSARGGNVGLSLRLPRAPLDLRLSYGADRAEYASGGSEFLDEISIAIVLRRQ